MLLCEIDLPSREAAELAAAADMQTGFDLFKDGGVLRGTLTHVLNDRYFLLNVHHIAFDGESMGVLLGELGELCRVLSSDSTAKNAALMVLPVQYVDYARWQRSDEVARALEPHHSYWREHLREGALPVLELPLDHTRPVIQTFNGDTVKVAFPADATAELEAVARSNGCTLFQLVIALWVLLLCRHAGQEEVVVGSPYHGRDAAGTGTVIGFFVNVFALRLASPRGGTIRDLIRQAREVVASAMRHAALPFQQIVHELLRKRPSDTGETLFRVMINGVDGNSELSGPSLLHLMPSTKNGTMSKFDLTFYMDVSAAHAIHGDIVFATSLFNQGSIERLAECLLTLGGCINTASLNEVWWEVRILPRQEEEKIVRYFNDNAATFPTHLCLHDMVTAQAAHLPAVCALKWQGLTMTYSVAQKCIIREAAKLCAYKLAPECLVALQLLVSFEQVVGALGVLVADSSYLPIDLKWPLERRTFMIGDASCPGLLTHTFFRSKQVHVDDVGLFVHEIDCALEDGLRLENDLQDPLLRTACKPSNVACVYYTSGSTGRPKGVVLQHESVVNMLYGAAGTYWRIKGQSMVFGLSTNYVFSAYLFSLMSCLGIMGATSMLLESELVPTLPSSLTHLKSVPSLISLVRIHQCVQQVRVGGEAITSSVMINLGPNVPVTNDFGPTEVAIQSAIKQVDRSAVPNKLMAIGRPLQNVAARVLEPMSWWHGVQSLQPIGVWGELCLGGVQVARGYLRRPERTAETFVANQWPIAEPSARGVVYRTGDRVRWYADGELEFGGRIDFQVKLRGQRIELGEIEHVLRAQTSILEAVVLLVKELDALVAYVSPAAAVIHSHEGMPFTASMPFDNVPSLCDVRNALPAYMLPSLVVGVDEWPRTSSGKLDRRRLPLPEACSNAEVIVEPRTREETAVRDVFASVLKVAAGTISVEVSFFTLGGNSLRAVQLARRLTEILGWEVGVPSVMKRPTVAGLAVGDNDGVHYLPPLTRTVDTEQLTATPHPVSWNQSQLLTVHLVDGATAVYNEPMAFWLHGTLAPLIMRDSIRALVARHAVLRTTYEVGIEGDFMQRVHLGLSDTTLLQLRTESKPLAAERLVATHASAHFDIIGKGVIRCTCVSLTSEESHLLLLNRHHIASDLASRGILFTELRSLYHMLTSRSMQREALPILYVQYVDYARWQRSVEVARRLEPQYVYWREHLREGVVPLLQLPIDHPRPAVQTFDGEIAPVALASDVTERLKALTQKIGCTLFQVMLSVWALLLCRHERIRYVQNSVRIFNYVSHPCRFLDPVPSGLTRASPRW